MSASARPWHCPTCLRSVPPRVESCYCGTSREQAQRAARAASPEEDAGGRLPWIPVALVALALGALVLGLRQEAPTTEATPPPPAGAESTPRPPPPLRGSPPRAAVGVPRRPAPVPAAPATRVDPPPATLPPAAEPELPAEEPAAEEDESEVRRREARDAFEARLTRLASRRDALVERLRAWDASCGASSSAVRPAGCVLLQEDIEELVDEVENGVRDAEQQARRDWVPPGDRRVLLGGLELDSRSWGALSRRARSALR